MAEAKSQASSQTVKPAVPAAKLPACPRCKFTIVTERGFPHTGAVDYICNRCAYVWRAQGKG